MNSQTSSPTADAKRAALEGVGKASSGAEAMARVKESEAYQNAQANVEGAAQDAESSAAVPSLKPLTSPTIRAASFPASVPEDK